jgi:organic hydroperoxide reductase OsmC/OhrA
MAETHSYHAKLTWTGVAKGPMADVKSFSRDVRIEVPGKPPIEGSADPHFLGDASRHNPEDLLVVSLSACHALSYLWACAQAKIRVISYEDEASGSMTIKDRRMRFVEVVLRPKVVIAADSDLAKAEALHENAHDLCFIANSVNFPVRHEAVVTKAG